tara:strand:+ start:64526 stop:65371 length:846 start_codon:yes stop_codon:yes gene_type:complete
MNVEEIPIVFKCQDSRLLGILHKPENPGRRGVVIVVGGPQTRVGSHRQFVLLARFLAERGIPVFRFDCRGMGDSDGSRRTFDQIHDDIECAIDEFQNLTDIRNVVLWGLCDGATAASFYAHKDIRVKNIVLVNPWVRTDTGEARASIRHHYLKRVFSRDLWSKIRNGQFSYRSSISSFFWVAKTAILGNSASRKKPGHLPERMAKGIAQFTGGTLIILSGQDLTAKEFSSTIRSSGEWRSLFKQKDISKREIPEADHTFSRSVWREQVEHWTLDWLKGDLR